MLDDHARRGAHHVLRVHAEHLPAVRRDLRGIGLRVHLRKQHKTLPVPDVDVDSAPLQQSLESRSHRALVVAPAQPAGQAYVESVPVEPLKTLHGRTPGSRATLFFVQFLAEVVQRDAQHQALGVLPAQTLEAVGALHHRAHGIGENQRGVAPGQAQVQHVEDFWVHERFPARETDLLHAERQAFRLGEKRRDFRSTQVDQSIVARCRLDIAVPAGQIAQRPGVEPQRPQTVQGDPCTRLALGGTPGIAELHRWGQWIGQGARDELGHIDLRLAA